MSRLPFEAFLALRYLRPRRTFVSIITIISILGVLLGVAVLIVVIAVMSGFDREWRNKILGFNAHLKIFQMANDSTREVPLKDFSAVMQAVKSNHNVLAAAPFIRGQVMVETQPPEGENPRQAAPIVLGVDPDSQANVSVLPTNIVAGAFDLSGNGLVIGSEFAHGMQLSVGDRVAVYSSASLQKMKKNRDKKADEAVLPEEFVVRGIFDVGFSEYNSSIIVASLASAQMLYEFREDEIHGLQVMTVDPFKVDAIRRELLGVLGKNFRILSWAEENPQIFGALATEKNMMFFLLFFIMIVAGFGIVNCQITFVVQKTHEIGILKALGANNRQVLWIFLSQSVVVGVLGVGCGLGLALLALRYRNEFLHLMNRLTGYELLPASIYQIYELPVSILPRDIAVICGTAFVTCLLAGLFPAWKAARR